VLLLDNNAKLMHGAAVDELM